MLQQTDIPAEYINILKVINDNYMQEIIVLCLSHWEINITILLLFGYIYIMNLYIFNDYEFPYTTHKGHTTTTESSVYINPGLRSFLH